MLECYISFVQCLHSVGYSLYDILQSVDMRRGQISLWINIYC
jgi:hypothetical protein